MFIVLWPRVGTPHIFNFQLSSGQLRTLCGKNMIKTNCLMTIGGDNVFDGICRSCSEEIDEMYQDDLKADPRIARNTWQARLENLRTFHYQEILGPAGTAYEMINRSWSKLSRAKKHLRKK